MYVAKTILVVEAMQSVLPLTLGPPSSANRFDSARQPANHT